MLDDDDMPSVEFEELLDDICWDSEVDAAAFELVPDTEDEPCPETVRSTRSPPIIAEATPVETALIQSLDLALTELAACKLAYEELMADMVTKENALRAAIHTINQIAEANENLYNGLVLQKVQFQTILANGQVPSKPPVES